MLIPLAVLAIGALFAGLIFRYYFIGEGFDAFWKGALSVAASNHILQDMEECGAGELPADADDARRRSRRGLYVYRRPETPRRLAESNPLLYNFLLNKWYFDELYDFLFVRPAFWLGRLFWKGGDGRIIDGIGPDGLPRASSTSPRRS